LERHPVRPNDEKQYKFDFLAWQWVEVADMTEIVCKAAESVKEVVQNTQLQVAYHFPCPIYIIERPDFLETVNTVSEEALVEARKTQELNEIYPVVMSNNYFADPRMAKFSEFIRRYRVEHSWRAGLRHAGQGGAVYRDVDARTPQALGYGCPCAWLWFGRL
jgi:hypothetical protein